MTGNKKTKLKECRLDLWLWASRIYKTRNVAASNIKKGSVRLSGKTNTKPSTVLNVGSQLVIEQDEVIKKILVEEIAVRRVSFEKAKNFYKLISKESNEAAKIYNTSSNFKPDKKVRRKLKALKEKLHFLSSD